MTATTQTCAVSSCSNAGTLRCTGCEPQNTHYCSQACAKADWKVHKTSCAGAQKYNCFIIRAWPYSLETASDPPKDADYIQPFSLRGHGNEFAEMQELKQRLGWRRPGEAAKFYGHQDNDTWYYYAYADNATETEGNCSMRNQVPSRCAGKEIAGDMVVVRSGPLDGTYPETFSKTELVRTAQFYKEATPSAVFSQRERSRAMRKFGFPPGFGSGTQSMNVEA